MLLQESSRLCPVVPSQRYFHSGNAMGKMHPLLRGTGILSRFGKSQSNARTKPEKHRLFSSVFEFEVSAKITFMIFFGASLNPKRGYIRFRFIVGSNGRHKQTKLTTISKKFVMKRFFQSEKGNQLTAFFSILGVPSTTIKFGNRNITDLSQSSGIRVKGC